jgi:hypothetical protein
MLPLHECGHRDVAVREHGDHFATGFAHRQTSQIFLPHQLRRARQRVIGRAHVDARAHGVVHRRARRTHLGQVPQHEVSEYARDGDRDVAGCLANAAALLFQRALQLDQALFDALPLALRLFAGQAQPPAQLVANGLELGDLGVRRGRRAATGS